MKRMSLIAFALSLPACYQEAQPRHDSWSSEEYYEDDYSDKINSGDMDEYPDCRMDTSEDEGCVEGIIANAHSIQFQGFEYFDANDLNNKIVDNLKFENQSGVNLVEGSDYKIEILQPFSNKNFTKNFEVHLKGVKVQKAPVRNNGHFYLNNLPEGYYEIRVQRPFDFVVNYKNEAGEATKKTFCATIYGEQVLDVFKGRQHRLDAFDTFELFVRDTDCGEKSTHAESLTL